jgi:hypothetical protein
MKTKISIFIGTIVLFCFIVGCTTNTRNVISENRKFTAKLFHTDLGAIAIPSQKVIIYDNENRKKTKILYVNGMSETKIQWNKDTLNIYMLTGSEYKYYDSTFESTQIKLHLIDFYSDFFRSIP